MANYSTTGNDTSNIYNIFYFFWLTPFASAISKLAIPI
jgi:hypothetical protein